MDSEENPSVKHRFKPGQSGNPAGRPRGSRNISTLLVEQMLSGELEEIVRAAIDGAKRREPEALRLCISRLAPLAGRRPIPLDLPPAETAADVAACQKAVVQAVAAGEITPDEAVQVSQVIEARRRAVETVDFERRLRKLEEAMDREEDDDRG